MNQIFSNLNGLLVAQLETLCKLFYLAGSQLVSYKHIDLRDKPTAEDLDVLLLMRCCCGICRSLVLGIEDKPSFFTKKYLIPLRSTRNQLTKLHLQYQGLIFPCHLNTTLSHCSSLTDMELHNMCNFRLKYVLRMVAAHCSLLERLVFRPFPDDKVVRSIGVEML
ncbi:unnamed protein product [Arabis nemorensis]|uniref:FBD domain-containing protein n=1 Tax=Arabis nemorensis TaxID=586526 RepID=A0A565AQ46_9BRAS|nr:unnamed protein product [Arabis nemorensis]